MLEDHTYFSVLYTLWKDDEVAGAFVPELLRSVAKATGSTLLKSCTPLLRMFFRSKVVRDLDGQVRCAALLLMFWVLKSFAVGGRFVAECMANVSKVRIHAGRWEAFHGGGDGEVGR